MTEILRVIGGSMDGQTISAHRADGEPLSYAYRSSTKEVWLRHGDELRHSPGATMEDGWIAFPSPESADEHAPDRMRASDRWIRWRGFGNAPLDGGKS